jgi:CRISPR-associated protein Cst2
MTMAKGLTMTLVFDGMSLNYGEGVGNISEIKKLSKGGEVYTYLSRQAIRYDIYRMLKEYFNMDADKEEPLHSDQKVVQFRPDVNIKDYMEADLFGYMKTKKKGEGETQTRPSVVRISPAISLEPFMNDLEFGTNKNFADRTGVDPNPFQFEHHYSLYSYTVTVDMDRLGVDDNDGINIEPKMKAERLTQLIEVIKLLNRDIKGRSENLNPLFVIGGVYSIKNPFFLNRIKVEYFKDKRKYVLNTELLKATVETSFNGEKVKDKTSIGYVKGFWLNEDSFNEIPNSIYDIDGFFENIKDEVKKYYEGTQG